MGLLKASSSWIRVTSKYRQLLQPLSALWTPISPFVDCRHSPGSGKTTGFAGRAAMWWCAGPDQDFLQNSKGKRYGGLAKGCKDDSGLISKWVSCVHPVTQEGNSLAILPEWKTFVHSFINSGSMCTGNTCYSSFHTLGNLGNQVALSRVREAVGWNGRNRTLGSIRRTLCALLEVCALGDQSHLKKKKCITFLSELLWGLVNQVIHLFIRLICPVHLPHATLFPRL